MALVYIAEHFCSINGREIPSCTSENSFCKFLTLHKIDGCTHYICNYTLQKLYTEGEYTKVASKCPIHNS